MQVLHAAEEGACSREAADAGVAAASAGTLTENRMTVAAGWFAGKLWVALPALADLPPALQREIQLGAALNSKV